MGLSMGKSEFDIVRNFSQKLGLVNHTDGSLFIYKPKKAGFATKPDGYYYYDGITFILDAKAENQKFTGQLEDYMNLETNENFIGFKYNGKIFECYVQGQIQKDEVVLQDKDYYKRKFFNDIKKNNEAIVSDSAKKLANLFRDASIDKQMNVPFIGASILCMKYKEEIDLTSTTTILNTLTRGINNIIADQPLPRKQKKDFIKNALEDPSLKRCKDEDLFEIMSVISTIYNFINISLDDAIGHDIMNNFLKIFRKWNSANALEKGEVFTPDHIAKLMYQLSFCSKENTILDPTCGSGTFLTNAMGNMISEASDNREKREIIEKKLLGIEINGFNVTLAGINMMLHGDGASNIFYEDCFEKLPKLKDTYDRVLMNPPFSQRDVELKFVYEALKNMKTNGILSTILPKSCVKGTDQTNLDYLKKIFNCCQILSVVSLPKTLFAPNAGADTCILTIQKTGKNNNAKTLLINCLDDGFELKNELRIDVNNNWKNISKEIIDSLNGKENEYRAVRKNLSFNEELLFEKFSSYRDFNVDKDTFERYLREKISSNILCGKDLISKKISLNKKNTKVSYSKFPISNLIEKVKKGSTKSIDRKLENKYDLCGIPLIVAKKDNNGVGGMTSEYKEFYHDKFCIVAGGDGGGGKCYYCDYDFCATNFILICKLKDKFKSADKYARFYLSVIISERLFTTIGHGRTISDVPNVKIQLPVDKNSCIDFDYMSSYIKNLPFSEFL